MLRRHFINVSCSEDIKPNEIWYKTSNNEKIEYDVLVDFLLSELGVLFVNSLVSNIQVDDEWWCLTFDKNLNSTGIITNNGDVQIEVLFYGTRDGDSISIETNVSNITAIKLPNIFFIGRMSFTNCQSLQFITIPNSVTMIEDAAFYDCVFAKENFINNSSLDAEANNYWGAEIVDVEIDGLLINNDTVITYRPYITSVTTPDNVIRIEDRAFENCSGLTSVNIGNSVTSIGSSAFSSCSSLTSITIGNSVTYVGYVVFSGCSSLNTIVVDADNTVYDSRDNCNAIIYTNKNRLDHGCYNTIIPNSVTSIGQSAFSGCSSLTSITIPNSVTSIDNSVFEDCSSLTSMVIGNGVTSIGEKAFYGCSSLNSITFEGTIEQWNAVTKGIKWNSNVPATVVHCTDGDVAL